MQKRKIEKVTTSERPRVSFFVARTATTYVVLLKENHRQPMEAATPDRKSGEAEEPAVHCL
jgi:hypothetical protein